MLGLTSLSYNTGVKQFELVMIKNFVESNKMSEYNMKI